MGVGGIIGGEGVESLGSGPPLTLNQPPPGTAFLTLFTSPWKVGKTIWSDLIQIEINPWGKKMDQKHKKRQF